MNRSTTVFLVLLAAALLGFLFFVKPKIESTRSRIQSNTYLLDFRSSDIQRLKIIQGSDVITLHRLDEGWEIETPIQDTASAQIVEKLLFDLLNLRVWDRIPERSWRAENLTLKDFGLETPKQRISLSGDTDADILLGTDAAGENRIFARLSNSHEVCVIDATLRQFAEQKVDAFRDTRLLAISPSQIQSFALRRADGEFEVVRSGNRWKLTRPIDALASSQAITALLEKILGAEVLSFPDQKDTPPSVSGLSDPRFVLRLTANQSEEEITLQIGLPAREIENAIYASVSNRPGVLVLPASIVDTLRIPLDDLRERRLFDINPDIVDLVEIITPEKTISWKRKGDDWIPTDAPPDAPVLPKGDMDAFLLKIGEAEVEKFCPPETLPSDVGLESPVAILRLSSILSENTPEDQAGIKQLIELRFGNKSEDEIYLQSTQNEDIALVNTSILEKIISGPQPITTWEEEPILEKKLDVFNTEQPSSISSEQK